MVYQIDHESAGTWDEDIVGDSGCSLGLAQMYWCPNNWKVYNRVSGQSWEKQVDEYVKRFVGYLEKTGDIKLAIVWHNRPASASRGIVTNYYYKVIKSQHAFIQK